MPVFKAVEVDAKVEIGYGITVADVNGDKRPDILLADKNLIVWYENPSWTKHVMAEKLTALDHVCIAAQDIDGDGRCEVAVGAGWNPGDTLNSGAVFYLVPPAPTSACGRQAARDKTPHRCSTYHLDSTPRPPPPRTCHRHRCPARQCRHDRATSVSPP